MSGVVNEINTGYNAAGDKVTTGTGPAEAAPTDMTKMYNDLMAYYAAKKAATPAQPAQPRFVASRAPAENYQENLQPQRRAAEKKEMDPREKMILQAMSDVRNGGKFTMGHLGWGNDISPEMAALANMGGMKVRAGLNYPGVNNTAWEPTGG